MLSQSAKAKVNLVADYTRWASAAVVGLSPYIGAKLSNEAFYDAFIVGSGLYLASHIAQVSTGRLVRGHVPLFSNRENYQTGIIIRDFFTAVASFFVSGELYNHGLDSLKSSNTLVGLSITTLAAGASHISSRKSLKRLEVELEDSQISGNSAI